MRWPGIVGSVALAGLSGAVVWVGHRAGRWLVPEALFADLLGAFICGSARLFPGTAFGPMVVLGAFGGIVRGRALCGWAGAVLGACIGTAIGLPVLVPFAMLSFPVFSALFATDPAPSGPTDPAATDPAPPDP